MHTFHEHKHQRKVDDDVVVVVVVFLAQVLSELTTADFMLCVCVCVYMMMLPRAFNIN